MISWTCTKCNAKYNVPESAVSPVRCPCGHVDHEPQFSGTPVTKPVAEVVVSDYGMSPEAWLELVHSLWEELHAFAFSDNWDQGFEWFITWFRRIPSFGCGCQEHFREVLKKHPPVFTNRRAFYLWSVDAHNEVNRRLGKRTFPSQSENMF